MLFVNGCSLLHFMKNIDVECPEALNLKLHQLLQIQRDTILLENQLPRRLLEMLSKEEGPKLEFLFSNHADFGQSKHRDTMSVSVKNPNPIHLLDYYRSEYLSPEREINIQMGINTIQNQQDDDNEDNNFQIDPKTDVLSKYECCSFISFMDSLIDNGEDVKELRLSGVFRNLLGSDEDLANLLNELGADLPTKIYSDCWCLDNVVAFSKKYVAVKQQIEKHYRTKWKTWLKEKGWEPP
uniref:Uncharacterized protein n=1 Tax=Cajanus cajan TaxID=3821 RepID=A0A151S694_CAJCA|nr:hypothetical protein KK1_027902 [Cajanus cajan]